MTFYDHSGKAVAYLHSDTVSVYLYSGDPVAWVSGEYLYAYSGKYLGWLVDGWVIDRFGNRVFFTEEASGGPVRPVRNVKPVKGVRKVRPVRGVREVRPGHPVRSLSWSALSGEHFFV